MVLKLRLIDINFVFGLIDAKIGLKIWCQWDS
jgi:hypothetical protein